MPAPAFVEQFPGSIESWVQGGNAFPLVVPISPPPSFTIGGAGNLLLVAYSSLLSSDVPSISDTNNNAWNPIVLTNGFGIWYAYANAAGLDTITVLQPGNGGAPAGDQIFFSWEISSASSIAAAASSGEGSSMSVTLNSEIFAADLPAAQVSVVWQAVIVAIYGSTGNPIVLAIVRSPTQGLPESGLLAPPFGTISGSWTSENPVGFDGYSATLSTWLYSFPAPLSSDIVTDICIRAGMDSSQVDVSLLTNGNIFGGSTQVTGYLVERPTPAAEVLKHLMQAYFFDACETNGKMKFVPRGMASALTVPEADLGLVSDKAKVNPETIGQAQDLPLIVNVLYDDLALDYQQNSQQRTRGARIVQTKQQKSISLPIVMTAQQALQIAETQLYLEWLERNGFKFNLSSPKYLLLDPTDVIEFIYEGLTFQIRIVENSLGVNLVTNLSGVNEDPTSFLSDLTAQATYTQHAGPVVRNPIRILAGTTLYLFDIPLLVDSDANPDNTGFYFAMFSSTPDWPGGVLYESSDDATFAQEGTSSTSAICGLCTTTLAAPASPWTLDSKNTLTVQPVQGALTGVTMLQMLNGANGLIVGNELVQFQTAVDNGDGTFTLSNLLRGLKGTEWACGSHASGEFFLALSSGIQRVQMAIAQLSRPLYYKGVSIGGDPTAISAQTFTVAGADLKPYAPAGIGGTADGSGNIIITWIRRTRIGGEADWADGVTDVPLSEDSELYDVEILNGSTVVRTISDLTTATCVYTTAMQTADFGSTQSSVTVNVYQRSAQVGRGTKATGVAPTPGGWPLPWAPIYPGEQLFYVNGS